MQDFNLNLLLHQHSEISAEKFNLHLQVWVLLVFFLINYTLENAFIVNHDIFFVQQKRLINENCQKSTTADDGVHFVSNSVVQSFASKCKYLNKDRLTLDFGPNGPRKATEKEGKISRTH